MNLIEALFLLSSALVLPVIAVLVIAYLNGSLTATEKTRFVVLLEDEQDYWTQAPADRSDSGAIHPTSHDQNLEGGRAI